MEKSMKLYGISMIALLLVMQSAVSSVIENKSKEPVIKQFMEAAKKGEKETLKKLHEQHSHLLNYQDGLDEWSALHHATNARRKSIVALLLSLKANSNIKNGHENTPLYFAARSGDAETVKLLIAHKACVHDANKDGDSPLHVAAEYCHQAVIDALLSHGAHLNDTNKSGKTAGDVARETDNG